jgi:hypothetical protein
MSLMIDIWGQAVTERAVACANALNQLVLHQEIQDSVDGNSIDLLSPVQPCNNFLRTGWMSAVSNYFQDSQAIIGLAQAAIFEQIRIITLITHNPLPFFYKSLRVTAAKGSW